MVKLFQISMIDCCCCFFNFTLKKNSPFFKQTKKGTIISFLLLFPFFSWSQVPDTSYKHIFKIKDVQYFTVDPLQNLYCLSSNEELIKYAPTGKPLFSYSNTTLGKITFIDASDPFNILLFYSEQQILVLLDRTLNERSQMDLRTSTIGQAAAVALSFDNNIWIFDDYEGILVKMDEYSNILVTSDFLGLSIDISQAASHIFIRKDKILVNFPEKGIAVFDLSARLEGWWELPGILDGQVLEQGFLFYTKQGFFIYYPEPGFTHTQNLPVLQNCTMQRRMLSRQYLLNNKNELLISHTFR